LTGWSVSNPAPAATGTTDIDEAPEVLELTVPHG
jgi:hypothetical protein